MDDGLPPYLQEVLDITAISMFQQARWDPEFRVSCDPCRRREHDACRRWHHVFVPEGTTELHICGCSCYAARVIQALKAEPERLAGFPAPAPPE